MPIRVGSMLSKRPAKGSVLFTLDGQTIDLTEAAKEIKFEDRFKMIMEAARRKLKKRGRPRRYFAGPGVMISSLIGQCSARVCCRTRSLLLERFEDRPRLLLYCASRVSAYAVIGPLVLFPLI